AQLHSSPIFKERAEAAQWQPAPLRRWRLARAELLHLIGPVEPIGLAVRTSDAKDARMLGGERFRAGARIVPDRETRVAGRALEAVVPLARQHVGRRLRSDVVPRLESCCFECA